MISAVQEVNVNGLVHFGEKIAVTVIIFCNGKPTGYNNGKIFQKDVKKIIVYVVVKFYPWFKFETKEIENITRWCEDMNFIFDWQNNILLTRCARS